jgi:hypothetical protein
MTAQIPADAPWLSVSREVGAGETAIIDPARICLKSVRPELVEGYAWFDKLTTNGVNTSSGRITRWLLR